MNVGELKAKLAEYPDDTMVVVNGYEGDYTELKSENVRQLKLERKDYESDYFGEWTDVLGAPIYGGPEVTVVALERN